jgi:hypothetical protein
VGALAEYSGVILTLVDLELGFILNLLYFILNGYFLKNNLALLLQTGRDKAA